MAYFNFDYDENRYYEVDAPMHDHYTYDVETNAWYEVILTDDGRPRTYAEWKESYEA